MEERLEIGVEVETVKPEVESTDWAAEVRHTRRWNVKGRIIGRSDAHGLVYNVEHEDGSESWYEFRELRTRSKPMDNWQRLRTNLFD